MTDLAEIERALAEATPGPWCEQGFGPRDSWIRIERDGWAGDPVCDVGHNQARRQQDARLIANAPTWLAALVARVRELEAEAERRDRYRAELEAIRAIAAPGKAWPYERVTELLDELERDSDG